MNNYYYICNAEQHIRCVTNIAMGDVPTVHIGYADMYCSAKQKREHRFLCTLTLLTIQKNAERHC